MQPLDTDGSELRATFDVEGSWPNFSVTFASGDGRGRNSNYRDGVRVVLERLGSLDAALTQAAITSEDVEKAVVAEGLDPTFVPKGFQIPMRLAGVDAQRLRRSLGTSGALVNSKPGSSGSTTRRMTLRLVLEEWRRTAGELEQVLAGRSPAIASAMPARSEAASAGSGAAAVDPSYEIAGEAGGAFLRGPQDAREAMQIHRIQGEVWVALNRAASMADMTLRKLRHPNGYEVDGVLERDGQQLLVEIKTTACAADIHQGVGQLLVYEALLALKPDARVLMLPQVPSGDVLRAVEACGVRVCSYDLVQSAAGVQAGIGSEAISMLAGLFAARPRNE